MNTSKPRNGWVRLTLLLTLPLPALGCAPQTPNSLSAVREKACPLAEKAGDTVLREGSDAVLRDVTPLIEVFAEIC